MTHPSDEEVEKAAEKASEGTDGYNNVGIPWAIKYGFTAGAQWYRARVEAAGPGECRVLPCENIFECRIATAQAEVERITQEYRDYKTHYDRIFSKSVVVDTEEYSRLTQERDAYREALEEVWKRTAGPDEGYLHGCSCRANVKIFTSAVLARFEKRREEPFKGVTK